MIKKLFYWITFNPTRFEDKLLKIQEHRIAKLNARFNAKLFTEQELFCFGSLIEKECTKGVRNFSVAELLEEFLKNKT